MKRIDHFACMVSILAIVLAGLLAHIPPAVAGDLPDVKQRGVLRHLGIPYANFVTGSGDGLDMDLMKLFARELGVQYEYVPTAWESWVGDLTGNVAEIENDSVKNVGTVPVKGDVIACGLTILSWRTKVADFSTPTFPTQVWLLTRADSPVNPIRPTQDVEQDIRAVKALLRDGMIKEVMGKKATCVDPDLYNLRETGVQCKLSDLSLNELAPALIQGDAEAILLDVPDALIALEKWTGLVKVIGPISEEQFMSVAFPKTSPQLRGAFERFFKQLEEDGTYFELVKRYYPCAVNHFPHFFKTGKPGRS